MNDIIKIVQALKDSNILLKGVTKTIKNETREQKYGFLGMLLGTLGATFWIFNAALSFNKFWNTEVSSEWS